MDEGTADGNGDGDGDPVAVERRSPEATFGLLGDDTRIAILEAMGETPDEAVGFSALRERVGTRDSGQFNYHLKKLLGSFVRKTDAGYELTYAGRQIVGAMYAGTYTANATVDPIEVDGECPLCGGAIVARYADETARIDCTECEEFVNEFSFPPGGLDQFTREELPEAFDRWMQLVFRGITAGFCRTCAGRMAGRVVVDDDPDPGDLFAELPAHVEYECGRCGSTARAWPATPVQFHSAVEGFLFDHGVDPQDVPSWRVSAVVGLPEFDLVSTDPPRLEVRMTHDGEAVVALVDSDASIVSVERRPVGE